MTQDTEKTDVLPNALPEFFLVVTPGLEDLAANELLTWLPDVEIKKEHGGLTIHADLVQGCELNRVLKIPTRILLRIASFTCRDFPKLFKKTSGITWGQWIPKEAAIEFQSSTVASRLFMKKRIEETCMEAFMLSLKRRGKTVSSEPDAPMITVQVRLDDNIATLSLDTSGEILHKRGTRALTSEAPIRETIASSLLFWMQQAEERKNPAIAKAGVKPAPQITLVDPMMGSGTFFLEAAQLFERVSERSFAFELFPLVERERRAAPEKTTLVSSATTVFKKFIGLDLDPRAVSATTGNLKPLIGQHEIEALEGDIFKMAPLATSEKCWLIANPPYGERLAIEGPRKDYYESLFEACETFAKPQRACFVLPESANPKALKFPRSWKLTETLKFQNGGIPVNALQFTRH